MKKTLFSLFIFLCLAWNLMGSVSDTLSFERTYHSRDAYTRQELDWIKPCMGKYQLFLLNQPGGITTETQRSLNETHELFMQLVHKELIVHDSIAEYLLKSLVKEIYEKNQLICPCTEVLIVRASEVNAFNLGNGLILVTTGLLSQLETVGEWHFLLAHEIAHSEKSHVTTFLNQFEKKRFLRALKDEFYRISKGKGTLEGLQEIQSIAYETTTFIFEDEMEADSLAMAITKNLNPLASVGARDLFYKLDAASQSPQLGPMLFRPFYFRDYPFQPFWLEERLSLYNREPGMQFLFNTDSIQTHPDVADRLKNLHLETLTPSGHQDSLVRYLNLVGKFENMMIAFEEGNLDISLYQALRLKDQFPVNNLVNAYIAEIFLKLYEIKTLGGIKTEGIQFWTSHKHPEEKKINDFLYNLRPEESLELGLRFLNVKGNFDQSFEDHYYLLYQLSDLLDRKSIKEKVANHYHDQFPKGQYRTRIKR